MKLVYFGSGAFGAPTFTRLATAHDIALVVTQPDRPAGRSKKIAATPIAELAQKRGLAVVKPQAVNDPAIIEQIGAIEADAFIVIAFGQKLGRALLHRKFAINLHASLLPKYRGAAPINWAMINGETQTGISVIILAERMDAGEILAQAATAIDPMETAGELHDRLAQMGPELVLRVLDQFERSALEPQPQDESKVTIAPKLCKQDGTVSFDQPAYRVRQRVHGLTPWPGCTVQLDDRTLRLARVHEVPTSKPLSTPGELLADGTVACAAGALRLLSVQPAGGKLMSFEAYMHGHCVKAGMRFEPA